MCPPRHVSKFIKAGEFYFLFFFWLIAHSQETQSPPAAAHATPAQQLTFQEGSQSHWDAAAAAFCGWGKRDGLWETHLPLSPCGGGRMSHHTRKSLSSWPSPPWLAEYARSLWKVELLRATHPEAVQRCDQAAVEEAGDVGFPQGDEAPVSASPTSWASGLGPGQQEVAPPPPPPFCEEHLKPKGNRQLRVFAEDQKKYFIPCKAHFHIFIFYFWLRELQGPSSPADPSSRQQQCPGSRSRMGAWRCLARLSQKVNTREGGRDR